MQRTYLLISLGLMAYSFLSSQSHWQENTLIQSSDQLLSPAWVDCADMDSDGDLDVLVASGRSIGPGSDVQLSWYENTNGQGQFNAHHILHNPEGLNSARYVFGRDIDGDGDQDVIWATGGSILWKRNTDGTGDFESGYNIIHSEFSSLPALYLSDLDLDGDFDIVGSSLSRDAIFWFENLDGDGSFGEERMISVEAKRTFSLYTADLDNDGDQDLLSASGDDDKVAWYENLDGKGNFGTQQMLTEKGEYANSVVAMDVDSDGDLDVLAAYSLGGTIVWFENMDGRGNFSEEIEIHTHSYRPGSLTVADFDGDNVDDFAAGIYGQNKLMWMRNESGGFPTENTVSTEMRGIKNTAAADLDGDGDMDLLACSMDDDKLAWFENMDGQGNFSVQNLISKPGIYSPENLHEVDMNLDGYMDIVFSAKNLRSDQDGGNIGYLLNIGGTGTFEDHKVAFRLSEIVDRYNVADIDGDDDLDFLIVTEESRLLWFEQVGTLDYEERGELDANIDLQSGILVTDMDGDGDMDIVISGDRDEKLIWLENIDGVGTFSTPHFMDEGFKSSSEAYSVDLDQDGDKDLVFHSEIAKPNFALDGILVWYENIDNLGNYSKAKLVSEHDREYDHISFGDIDGDGDVDIAFERDGVRGWFKNDGKQNFEEQEIDYEFNGRRGIVLSDLDLDGDLDLIGLSNGQSLQQHIDGEVVWYENLDGLGNYGGQQLVVEELKPDNSMLVMDVDHDGYKDIVVARKLLSKIAWYKRGKNRSQIFGHIQFNKDTSACGENSLDVEGIKVVARSANEELTTFSLANGYYQIFPNSDGNYTVEAKIEDRAYLQLVESTYEVTIDSVGDSERSDYCINYTNLVDDIKVDIVSVLQSRPGFPFYCSAYAINEGTTVISGEMNLTYDTTRLELINVRDKQYSVRGDQIILQVDSLQPFHKFSVSADFRFKPPPVNMNGDLMKLKAEFTYAGNDATPDNNYDELCEILIGSFDPNDIHVQEGSTIVEEQADDYLHYRIRFQNTGTAEAINVRVENQLDRFLDWSTLELENVSHQCRTTLDENGLVNFNFSNIYLPDSTNNEPESHGFITYKIKPINTLHIGDIISNTADIYFDFNEPVITNTVTTELIEPLSTQETIRENTILYPTITEGELNIVKDTEVKQLVIYDSAGKPVMNRKDVGESVDISLLPTGVYFCHLQKASGKFVGETIIKI